MSFDVLIDGYNLLHAAGLAKPRYAPGDLQRRRARLLQKLAELVDPTVLARTTVVFDARRDPPTEAPVGSERGFAVLFAPKQKEADDLIEELLAKHSSPKQVLVVSSDHRLHKAARRRGATAIDSEVFLDQLERDGAGGRSDDGRQVSGKPAISGDETPEALSAAAEAELRKLVSQRDKVLESFVPESTERAESDEVNDPTFWEWRIQGGGRKPRSKPEGG
jgi:predicted RNA-binding protein with PIN domain